VRERGIPLAVGRDLLALVVDDLHYVPEALDVGLVTLSGANEREEPAKRAGSRAARHAEFPGIAGNGGRVNLAEEMRHF
jgi:hypothetical protein